MTFRNLYQSLLIVLLISVSVVAYAAPPALLYRADTRAPDGETGIFRMGFLSWGNNRDLRAHQLGLSCGIGDVVPTATADSAYVSVSNSLDRARQFAERSFSNPRPDIWIYTIRATPQFYDVAATVANAMNYPDQAILNSALQVHFYQGDAIEAEGEYVSTGVIDRSVIREATRYQWNSLARRYEEIPNTSITNIHYVPDSASRANANPLDPRIAFAEAIQPAQVNQYVTIGLSIFGACACMSKSGVSLVRHNAVHGDNTYCHPTLRNRNASSMLNLHLFD